MVLKHEYRLLTCTLPRFRIIPGFDLTPPLISRSERLDGMGTDNGLFEIAKSIVGNVGLVIIGKEEAIERGVIALLCGGHLLIEDVPGVGKTMLARSIARTTGCSFSRIQFTPDLLPSDITGVSVFNQSTTEFEYRPGPIISQVVLADEINRATPKTQSALLEAMGEGQVTIDGLTHVLPKPAVVLATLNPIDYEGTFPLPEGQLDRFLMRIDLGYPAFDDEVAILESHRSEHPIDTLQPVVTPELIIELQEYVRRVHADPLILRYIVSLVEATRGHMETQLGVSPRGSLALFRTSQALAFIRGRDYVLPDDVKEMARSVLAHRIVVTPSGRMKGIEGKDIVNWVLEESPIPSGRGSQGWAAR